MLKDENQSKVESAFKRAIYSDRARVQTSNISRFGLLEISRQRLRPSLNESYDIEHVLVRGPRSLGQSILRIVGEDAAKDNTGEIHVYVPADVASYLLNEKRYDIINIEKTNNIKILVIADPYKSRPYYKVVRIKSSDVKSSDSYKLTPDSPEPNTSWRDSKNDSKSMKPVVDGIKPPKMPKKKKDGLVKWLKSITGIETEQPVVKKKPQRRYKKNNNKSFKTKEKSSSSNNKNYSKVKSQKSTKDSKITKSKKVIKKPLKTNDTNKKEANRNFKKKNKQAPANKMPKKIEPAIREIVKEKKVKKDIPMRAKNDPRQKTE